MKLPINLASNPYENLRPFYTAAWMAAVLLLALTAGVVWKERQNRNETRLLAGQIRQYEKEAADLQQEQRELERWLVTRQVQEIRDRSAFLNTLIARKSLSWTQMFMDLEKILPERAQLTTIRPSLNQSQQAELKLSVTAASLAPLVEFLKNLESSPRFGSPVVESQRFTSEKTGESIAMEVSAQYYPGVPAPEPKPTEATLPRKAEDSPSLANASAGRSEEKK